MPDDQYYLLTRNDRALLDALAQQYRGNVRQPRYEEVPHQYGLTPDIILARTPEGGIPALTRVSGDPPEDIPGSAVCDIYETVWDYPEQRAYLRRSPGNDTFQERVFNESLDAIGGNRWVKIVRTRDGRWYVIAPTPFPSDDDTTTTGTGTGTGGGVPDDGGTVPFPPGDCDPIYIEETDLFCQGWEQTPSFPGGGLGTGTGTGTDEVPAGDPSTTAFLNLYRRRVFINYDPFQGCLSKSAGPWEFVRTVGCCDFDCVEPDTGTGTSALVTPSCCDDREIEETLDFDLTGELLSGCNSCTAVIGGTLTRPFPGLLEWSNGSGTTGCDENSVTITVRLYCSGDQWKAYGTIFRSFTPFNIDYDIALTEGAGLTGVIPIPGCFTNATLSIEHPCPEEEPEPEPGGELGCCAGTELPAELVLTFSAGGGGCECLDGLEYTLTYDDGSGDWLGSGPGCGADAFTNIRLYDSGGGCLVDFSGCLVNVSVAMTADSCDPFVLTRVLASAVGPCCSGTVTITITEP